MQFNFNDIDPQTTSGTALAELLENFKEAVYSSHKGPTAPSYATAGLFWLNDTATPWVLSIYSGTLWSPFADINPTTGVMSLRSIRLSIYTETISGAPKSNFAVAYAVGSVAVFLNGVRLDPTDYTATNGTTVILGEAAAIGDEILIQFST